LKRIIILGSTGSIGTQTLEVVKAHPDKFKVVLLAANSSADLLIEQAREIKPNYVVIANKSYFEYVRAGLFGQETKVFHGIDAINDLVSSIDADLVITAMVGFAGLIPTLKAIESGKNIALANKETLVVAGDIVTQTAERFNVKILPIDSEHSAIFQCLVGEESKSIEKIILTASGGPFRKYTKEQLQTVTPEDALKHPNWSMGAKITIDSATMMNKGLEIIEARWLFNLSPEQIDVIIHPQSIIHSMVQFTDGSMKAQMGLPDMRIPIQYALTYPERLTNNFARYQFHPIDNLTFEKPDCEHFQCLQFAFDALHQQGNYACIINAANEIAVAAFLKKRIKFSEIPKTIEYALNKVPKIQHPTLQDYINTDSETRLVSASFIETLEI